MSSDARVRVAFKTLGCKVNRVESDEFAAELIGRGAVVVAEQDAPEVVVVNTCTVTGEADAKARKAVRHALRLTCEPVVVVTGCLATLDPDGLAALGPRVIVEADKSRVPRRVGEALGLDYSGVARATTRAGGAFRTRGTVKVQDGCDNYCSYCIVPHARGGPRATPLAEVVRQAEALVDAGVREIVLTGINIGRYRDGEADLGAVVRAVERAGATRIRLSSIEPPDVTAALLESLAATASLCPHLHIPLQSGSDRVLSAMERRYTSGEYEQVVARAREALPGLTVTTDVICGFPGETDDDYHETRNLLERVGFSKVHVFRYSERDGTPAAAMPQIPKPVRAQRAEDLRALASAMRERYIESRLGERDEVLVEESGATGAIGTTRDYLRVEVSGHQAPAGSVAPVVLESLDGDVVRARLDQ